MVSSESVINEPIWKLDRLGSAGQLFWRRDSEGLINRKTRVKFNYEVEVLEYMPHECEKNRNPSDVDEENSTLKSFSSTLHVVLVGLVCIAATVTTFTWLVQ